MLISVFRWMNTPGQAQCPVPDCSVNGEDQKRLVSPTGGQALLLFD
jgi:hypothetical protein